MKNYQDEQNTLEFELTTFLAVPKVKLTGVSFSDLSRYGNIAMDLVNILNPQITAYKEALHFKDRVAKPLPHQIIRGLKTGLNINKIQVTNLDIGYRELSEKTAKLAVGSFQNVNLVITISAMIRNGFQPKLLHL